MARTRIKKKLLDGDRLVRSFAAKEVRAALEPMGLTDEEIARGRALAAEARGLQRDFSRRLQHTPVVGEIVEWQRRRFPVIRAILEEEANEFVATVFDGVETTSGDKVLWSVECVCERLLALAEGTEAQELTAWKAIERHKITRDEITAVFAKATAEASFEIATARGPATIDARDAAVAKLHAFRKKWAKIARAVIDDGMLLRAMGARGTKSAAPKESAEE